MKVDTVARLLREHGFKLTPQRRAILQVITGHSGHMTPAQIHQRVQSTHPTIGLVTVYRTLDILADLDLVCRVHGDDACRSYLLRRPAGHHHHVVCSSCGKVADFGMCNLSQLGKRLSRETGFQIQTHLLEFNGICRECQNTSAPRRRSRRSTRMSTSP